MKLRLTPATRALHLQGPKRDAGRWQGLESLLRTCQLVLILWLAFLGAQWAAKGVVQAGTLLVGLLR